MSPGSHASPSGRADQDPHPHSHARRRSRWSIGTPVVGVLSGALFVVSAHNSQGTDLRPGRYTDLASLVSSESRQYDDLRQHVTDLNADIERLTATVKSDQIGKLRRRAEAVKGDAGLEAVSGPGLTVTLSDSPPDVAAQSDVENKNLLVVHQQDIQAVVNAMWVGGATAVTIQGQRVVSTTGIRCVGNAVQLQGVPYSQPYVVSAVGDPARLQAVIESDPYLQAYRTDASDPEIGVGWDEQVEERVDAPAYDGLLDLTYAQVLPPS